MSASASPPAAAVRLVAARSGWTRLVPEQSALFDVTLRNDTPAPRQVTSLNDNDWTPVVRALDATGKQLAQGTPRDLTERIAGHMGEPQDAPPALVTLAPGDQQTIPVELWHFMSSLPPGRYAVEISHSIDPAAPTPLSSGQVPFEIVPARVDACALGYESSQRLGTVLAWIAAPADTGKPELFARSSGSAHAAPQVAGRPYGAVPPGARIALGHLPPDAATNWLGYVAVASGRQVEIHQHNMGAPEWRSGPIALPIDDATPVPRFPDRGRAVFLATGRAGDRAALAGVVAAPGAPPQSPWAVPIAALPRLSACAFAASGAVAVILVADDGGSARVTRIDVDESGAVAAPEHLIRQSPNEALALAVDLRPGAPPVLLILEGSRVSPDRLALVRIPLVQPGAGAPAPQVIPFAPLRGWPTAPAADGALRPLRAREVALDIGWDGAPHVALVDELGRLFAGALDGAPLAMLRDAALGAARCPHLGALRDGVTPAAFLDNGALFFAGGGGHH